MKNRFASFAVTLALASPLLAATPGTQSILAELATADDKIAHLCLPQQLLDPKYRQSIRPLLTPLLQERQRLYAEWQAAAPKDDAARRFLMARNSGELAYLGDEQADAALQAQATDADAAVAAAGTYGMAFKDWCNARDQAVDQSAILDKLAPLSTARPTDEAVVAGLNSLLHNNPATPELAARIDDLIIAMKTPFSTKFKAQPNQLGKPLKINSTTVAGKPFDSTKWKGKVVMIDFWATWCPPCMAELPKVVETYQKYHDQGLEIVGVSSDQSKPVLVSFLKEHTDVVWPQLCNGGQAWHPLTKLYGINSIPTVYLIDRNGLLRSMTARGATEELIPQLLAESATDAPPAAGPVSMDAKPLIAGGKAVAAGGQ